MVKPARWMDTLSIIFSLAVVVISAAWVWQRGTFNISLAGDTTLNWHLIRSAGLSAYFLMTIAMVWGLAVSSRLVKDWSPGVLSMLLHSTISYLSLIFAAGHALLLLRDDYYVYHIRDLVVPFVGPYRPFAVGLGVLAFWAGLMIALSFSIKKHIGHQNWKRLHYLSYGGYGLITLHALLAGADAHLLGFKVSVAVGVLAVITLLAYRVGKTGGTSSKPTAKAAAVTKKP